MGPICRIGPIGCCGEQELFGFLAPLSLHYGEQGVFIVGLDRYELRDVFDRTVVVRRPSYGIISGYHQLPYICLGESSEPGSRTLRVRGKIEVSPQFVLRPSHYDPNYEDIFGEENVDVELRGRVFGFLGFRRRPVECKSDHLEVSHLEVDVERALKESMDELERFEDITTGIIITPNVQYYQVSIERFIASVLDDEFKE